MPAVTGPRPVTPGQLLWEPDPARAASSRMSGYMRWLADHGRSFASPEELWQWSVRDLEAFWGSAWKFLDVRPRRPYETVLADRTMPGTRWFPGAELNYAEHALRRRGLELAMLGLSEDGTAAAWSRDRLASEVARISQALRELGVGRGDRVVAYLPNIPEAVAAFLATASLGAIWSSCSPDFGAAGVLDRWRQVEPKVLIAVNGYAYGGKQHDRRTELAAIRAGLPTLTATIRVRVAGDTAMGDGDMLAWSDVGSAGATLSFESVPSDHPLWILYSSGTTGLPKAIVHGHAGILVEHLKVLALHSDLGEGDRFFWFTTTGWMMWNYLVSGLLVGSAIVLYDGHPMSPGPERLWSLAAEHGVTYFGASAPYLLACMKTGIVPREVADTSRLRSVGSTGAPLPAEAFAWVIDSVSPEVQVASVSGGTDACTAFVLSHPLLPVHAGEIQCRALGAKVEAFDESGRAVIDEVGELVITAPLPSMPLRFWNDPDGTRLKESYFVDHPGTWRHGDWIRITPRGSCIITGRSDATLNRGGVRMGTSEFYGIVEAIPEVADSLVVDTGALGREDKLWLFVALREDATLDAELRKRIERALRSQLSPRHVPDEIRQVPTIPRTINGKKLEVPVKKILLGTPLARAANPATMSNPDALAAFVEFATKS